MAGSEDWGMSGGSCKVSGLIMLGGDRKDRGRVR